MKPEIKFKWIVNLLNSEFLKGGLFKKEQNGGCKTDFERVAGASKNDKTFNKWCNELINDGTFEFAEEIKTERSKPKKTYVINYCKLEKRLINNPLHDPAKGYYWRYYKNKAGFFELGK